VAGANELTVTVVPVLTTGPNGTGGAPRPSGNGSRVLEPTLLEWINTALSDDSAFSRDFSTYSYDAISREILGSLTVENAVRKPNFSLLIDGHGINLTSRISSVHASLPLLSAPGEKPVLGTPVIEDRSVQVGVAGTEFLDDCVEKARRGDVGPLNVEIQLLNTSLSSPIGRIRLLR
jgi:hypothetical protein